MFKVSKERKFPFGDESRTNNKLKTALSERGFGSERFKDGRVDLDETLLTCNVERNEWYSEYDGGISHYCYRLYFQDQIIATTIERTDDVTRLDLADQHVFDSLPQSLVSSRVKATVLRRAFVAEKKEEPDYRAPDGSIITYLIKGQAGDFGDSCHCELPIGKTSTAVKHQTVQELWHFTQGEGQFWLKTDVEEEGTMHEIKKGTSILIHPGVSFQFRNISSDTALKSIITTMPPWPGPLEAVFVEGIWRPSVNSQSVQDPVEVDSHSIDSGVLTTAIASTEIERPISPSRTRSSTFGNSVNVIAGSATANTIDVQSPIVGQSNK